MTKLKTLSQQQIFDFENPPKFFSKKVVAGCGC